jgi:hypothetical protein
LKWNIDVFEDTLINWRYPVPERLIIENIGCVSSSDGVHPGKCIEEIDNDLINRYSGRKVRMLQYPWPDVWVTKNKVSTKIAY